MAAPNILPNGTIRPLDPFGLSPGTASHIGGLGGAEPAENVRYAFHTLYVPAGGQRIRFHLEMTGLQARKGFLNLAIHALPSIASAHARKVERRRVALTTCGPELVLDIVSETFPATSYALTGEVSIAADAQATGLSIDLYSSGEGSLLPILLDSPIPTDATTALFSSRTPTLEEPVSQMCTASQFDEPAFAHWLARLGTPLQRHRKQWEFVYILQALDRFGALRPGARGLGFGVGREPLPALFASAGIDIVATDMPIDHDDMALWHDTSQHVSTIESLFQPAICTAKQLETHVTFRPVDMMSIPDDLSGFDFTWSSCAFEHLGSIEAGLAFVERSVACLRPGGIAVHTTELNLSSDTETIDHASTVLFRRRDITRLALRLIAQGHDVAPLNFDSGDTPMDLHIDLPPYENDPHLKLAFGNFATTSFGISIRRGQVTDD